MQLLTLDFETYFSDDYNLSKMTTEEYVRDPRFKVHCAGVQVHGDGKAPLVLRGDENLRIKGNAIICHHAHFEGLIMSHRCDVRSDFWFDTLSMARLVFPHAKSHSLAALAELLELPKKTVPYQDFKNIRNLPPDLYNRVAAGCAQDVELTYAIFKKMLPLVPQSELRLIDLTIRMFTEPALRLNRELLSDYLAQTREQKEDILARLGVTKKDLGSAEKFAALLQSLGVEPPTKISKTTGEITYAFAKTDSGMKALLEHDDVRVAELAAARLGVKSNIMETRGERLLAMDRRGPMPVYLKYYGAHTGRWSGGDKMNWQNFKRGSVLREGILAPEGHVLCVVDLAQIECRVLNWLAGQEDVLEAFRSGADIYCVQASKALGRTITKENKPERFLFKTAELGLGYGMGPEKFALVLAQQGIEADASSMVRIYRTSHPCVKELWRAGNEILDILIGTTAATWGPMTVRDHRIYYPGGSWSDYSNLKYNGKEYFTVTRKGAHKMYGAKLVENVVQALSRVIMGEMVLKISQQYKIATCTHDEVVYIAKANEADKALEFGLTVMKTPPAWAPDLPLDAEGDYAVNYSK